MLLVRVSAMHFGQRAFVYVYIFSGLIQGKQLDHFDESNYLAAFGCIWDPFGSLFFFFILHPVAACVCVQDRRGS